MDGELDAHQPNYTFIFQFEKDFKQANAKEWMLLNWHKSLYAVAIYMVVIFGGQAYMAQRPAYKLRKLLILWNTCLALFSIIGTLRTMPELLHALNQFGFNHSVCNSSYMTIVKPSTFWVWLFTLSKVPELGDTVFIVLRKQKLIFLHWYHHVTVLVFAWYSFGEYTAPGRWCVYMNYLVHSLMYSYYALRSLGFKIPTQLAMAITTLQITQMIMGAFVTWYAYYRKLQGYECTITETAFWSGLVVYLSYFALFAHFFYQSYFANASKKAGQARAVAASKGQKVE